MKRIISVIVVGLMLIQGFAFATEQPEPASADTQVPLNTADTDGGSEEVIMEAELPVAGEKQASVPTLAEQLHASGLYELKIPNSETTYYYNDFTSGGNFGYQSVENAVLQKGYDSEQGSVLSLSAATESEGFVTYEFGSAESVWDGSTADVSWYDATKTSFELYTAADIAGFASLVNAGEPFAGKTVTLKSNINWNNQEWTPIGTRNAPFKGIFDGDGNEVRNIKVTKSIQYIGILGYVDSGAVKNLGAVNSTVNLTTRGSNFYIGGIAGYLAKGTMDSCYVKNMTVYHQQTNETGTSADAMDTVGTFIGYFLGQGTVSNCYADGISVSVPWRSLTGGFFGFISGTGETGVKINNCYIGSDVEYVTNSTSTIERLRYYLLAPVQSHANTATCTAVYYGNSQAECDGYTNPTTGELRSGAEVKEIYKISYSGSKSGPGKNTAVTTAQLGAAFREDIFCINEGRPVLASQKMPITDAMNISFAVKIPIGENTLKTTLFSGKEEIVTVDFQSFPRDAWSRVLLSWNGGTWSLYNNGELVFINQSMPANVTVADFFAFTVSGKVLIDDLKIYHDESDRIQVTANAIMAHLQNLNGQFPEVDADIDLNVPGLNAELVWSTSDSSVLDASGVIQERKNCSIPVTLSAMMTFPYPDSAYAPATAEIAIPLVIAAKEGASDQEIVDDISTYLLADANVTEQNFSQITENLKTLPAGSDGAVIAWESSNEAVIAADGTVCAPEAEDAEVTLTATITLNDVTETKTFNLTVLAIDTILKQAASALDYSDLTTENRLFITQDLTLPVNGLYDTAIVWTSNRPDCITTKGYLLELSEDAYVTLTAEFLLAGRSVTKTFDFVVRLSDTKKLEADIEAVFVPSEVTEGFTVPLTGTVYESTIYWQTSNSAYLEIDGTMAKITRPENEVGNQTIQLTATFLSGTVERRVTYTVTVLALPSDQALLQEQLDAINFEDISYELQSAVTSGLHLDKSFPYGITYNWTSSNPTVVGKDGSVIRPDIGDPDAEVTMTLTLTRRGECASKDITFTVKAFGSDEDILTKAKDLLVFSQMSNEPINLVTQNLTLPGNWKYGTVITWESSKPEYLSVETNGNGGYTGVVVQPAFGSQNVSLNLTATISYGGSSVQKNFLITIAENNGEFLILGENFEKFNIGALFESGGTYSGNNKDSITHLNTNQTSKIASDPTNPSNKVMHFVKTAGSAYDSNSKAFVNVSIPAAQRTGWFRIRMKLYIEELPELQLHLRCNFGGIDEIFLYIDPTGRLYRNADYVATETVPFKQWNELILDFDTSGSSFNVYLNDKIVMRNIPYSKNLGTLISSFKFSYVAGTTAAQDGVPKQNHICYIDDILINRTRNYSAELTDAMDDMEKQFLAAQNINAITENLILPDLSAHNVSVKCSSSNPDVVAEDGTVTRPKANTGDVEVVYTVTVHNEYGGERSRVFCLKVKEANYISNDPAGTEDDAVAVIYDAKQAIVQIKDSCNINYITGNLLLPTTGINGSTLTWESSAPEVLSKTGTVTRGSTDQTVTLTLTATLNGVSERLSMNVIVKADGGGTGSGGMGGGSVGAGAGTAARTVSGYNSDVGNNVSMEEPPVTSDSSFADIENHWAKEYIEELYQKGVVNGTGDGEFSPEDTVTREEFLTMLLRALEYELAETGERNFLDVQPEAWYYTYVITAWKEGIVHGISDTRFGVGESITRQDLCIMIDRAVRKYGIGADITDVSRFADDSSIAMYAKDAVYNLLMLEVVNGKENNCFDPTGYATRAEAAKIVAETLNLMLLPEVKSGKNQKKGKIRREESLSVSGKI